MRRTFLAVAVLLVASGILAQDATAQSNRI
jgi:predicted small secreted protein